MKIISTTEAPKAIGPFSQAIECDGLVYCSGQISLHQESMKVVGNNVKAQTLQIFSNIKAVLKSCNLNLSNIVKTSVYLKDMGDFNEMNSVYEKEFGKHKPARTTLQVARLPLDVLIEIDCIASVNIG